MRAVATDPEKTEIVFVVAVAENGVIGHNNALPWQLKGDLKRFKAITFGKPIVMGRKTFQSIGRPLPGRTNIVVTRDAGFTANGIVIAPNLDYALEIARGDALRRFATEIAVLGGADLFAQWMDRADRLEITEVHASPEGDTRFPALDRSRWVETGRERRHAVDGESADYSFVTLRRAASPDVGR
jgi:dihydrofolate reductase